jgi:CTP synthase
MPSLPVLAAGEVEEDGLEARRQADFSGWEELVQKVRQPKPKIKIALVGKYVELHDAYMSVREALKHAGLKLGVKVDILWVHSAELEKGRGWDDVQQADGILVPGGFGSRGIEGKLLAARYARENNIPYLGLCLGMQLMVVDFARMIYKSEEPNSTEFDRGTPYPVIDLMPDQRGIVDMGGTMRLGLYPCELQPGTLAAEAYQQPIVQERHRHRFELNNHYREILQQNGMRFSGISPDGRLVEIAELENHPFMLGTQFHPEFLSRPNRPHPLFVAFLNAVKQRSSVDVKMEEILAGKID